MTNAYFDPTALTSNTLARAASVNSLFDAIEAGFDKLPTEANIKQGKVNYAVDTGAADAYVASLPHAPASLDDGLSVVLKISAGNTNTGSCNLTLNGLGPISIKTSDGSNPVAGEVPGDTFIPLRHDGTNWRIVGASPGSAAAAAASAAAALVSENNSAASETSAEAAADLIVDWEYIEGGWQSGDTYAKNNIVFHSATGGSYISLQDGNQGNTPAFNGGAGTAFWGVFSQQGAAGAGSGDVLGANNGTDFASAATTFANLKQDATTSATGVLEIATDGEAQAKSATDKALVASNLAALGASATFAGLVELATPAEIVTGTDTDRAATAEGVQAALNGAAMTRTANIAMADNELLRAQIRDYALPVTADGTFTGTEDIDLENGNVHELTLSGNVTTLTISNWPATGNEGRLTLYIHQDSTARTIAWPAAVIWSGGSAPDLSTVDETYVVVLTSIDAGTTIYGFLAGSIFA